MGGKIPGTAQLEATARASPTPDSWFHTRNDPSAASTAVHAKDFRGHAPSASPPSHGANRAMNSSSAIAAVFSAQAPISARTSSAGRLPDAASIIFMINVLKSGGGPCDARTGMVPFKAGSALSPGDRPSASPAPTNAPADVPTIKSAVDTSTPRSANPASSPDSHAIPTGPPPPKTSAFVIAPVLHGAKPGTLTR